MKTTLVMGLVMVVLVTVVSGVLWSGQSALAAGIFGALALLIQLGAIALITSVPRDQFKLFLQRWAMGMGLRVVGIGCVALAVGLDQAHFPAVATATGFLGVLVPLLFFEARVIR